MRSRRLGSIAVLALMLASLAFGAIAPATAAEPGWLSGAIEQGLAAARDGVRCDASQTLTVEGGRAVRSSILGKMDGFARASETTGGLGQRVLVVRSLDDDRLRDGSGPPGSLREAVWLAKQAGGGWIVFSDDLPSERRIDLVSGLVLPSNVTIDGGCRGFTVSSDHGASVLTMRNVANVVVMRLHIEQRAPFVHGSGDCVNGNGADRIWVAFNVLRRCEDGLVDIGVRNYKPDRPVRATVAYNLFEDHEKDMLLATYDCQADHVGCDNQLGIAWMWNGGVQVTVQGNLFDRTSERHPRLSGQSYAHLVDNVIAFAAVERSPGVFGATYGSFTGVGGRLLADHNLYIAPGEARLKAIRSDAGQGAARSVGNVVLGDAGIDENGSELVPAPPYKLRGKADWSDAPRAVACAASRIGPDAAEAPGSTLCQR